MYMLRDTCMYEKIIVYLSIADDDVHALHIGTSYCYYILIIIIQLHACHYYVYQSNLTSSGVLSDS